MKSQNVTIHLQFCNKQYMFDYPLSKRVKELEYFIDNNFKEVQQYLFTHRMQLLVNTKDLLLQASKQLHQFTNKNDMHIRVNFALKQTINLKQCSFLSDISFSTNDNSISSIFDDDEFVL